MFQCSVWHWCTFCCFLVFILISKPIFIFLFYWLLFEWLKFLLLILIGTHCAFFIHTIEHISLRSTRNKILLNSFSQCAQHKAVFLKWSRLHTIHVMHNLIVRKNNKASPEQFPLLVPKEKKWKENLSFHDKHLNIKLVTTNSNRC